MARYWFALGAALVLVAATAAAAPAPVPPGPMVTVNGQPLLTEGYRGPHIHNDRVFVPVADFAWLVGADWTWDAATGKLTFAGKDVTYDFQPAPHIHDDRVYAPVRVLAAMVGGKVQWIPNQSLVSIEVPGVETPAQKLGLPPGVGRLSGVVPAMGEHWADPRNLPLGPIYGVYNGKVIFWEFMISQEDFKAGKSFEALQLLKLQPVDHVDIQFLPNGHPGFEVPHYDIHAYFIPVEEQRAIHP